MSLLEVDDLSVSFSTRHGEVAALDGVSFHVDEGETLGVVGESGCGKSITALTVMGLIPHPPGRITGGSIRFRGEELVGAKASRLRRLRGAEIAMIFQESMTSLNPVFRVGDQIAEAVLLHQDLSKAEAWNLAVEFIRTVGIPEPVARARAYPHELSGGMRQRVTIAMAMSCRPRLLIADEPTTALDVTVQAQIFGLMRDLQEEFGVGIIMITHDMGAIAELSDRVAVMYAGRIVEQGTADEILDTPLHPYTRGLIACIPTLGKETGNVERFRPLEEIPGSVRPLHLLDKGCAFADRCALVHDACGAAPPLSDGPHSVACHAARGPA